MACGRCGYQGAMGPTDCPRCAGGSTGMTYQEAQNLQNAGEQAGMALGGCLLTLGTAAAWIGVSRPMAFVWAVMMFSWVTLTPGMLIVALRLPADDPAYANVPLWDFLPLWYLVPALVAPLVLAWIFREKIVAWRKWIFALLVLVMIVTSVF